MRPVFVGVYGKWSQAKIYLQHFANRHEIVDFHTLSSLAILFVDTFRCLCYLICMQ